MGVADDIAAAVAGKVGMLLVIEEDDVADVVADGIDIEWLQKGPRSSLLPAEKDEAA